MYLQRFPPWFLSSIPASTPQASPHRDAHADSTRKTKRGERFRSSSIGKRRGLSGIVKYKIDLFCTANYFLSPLSSFVRNFSIP